MARVLILMPTGALSPLERRPSASESALVPLQRALNTPGHVQWHIRIVVRARVLRRGPPVAIIEPVEHRVGRTRTGIVTGRGLRNTTSGGHPLPAVSFRSRVHGRPRSAARVTGTTA